MTAAEKALELYNLLAAERAKVGSVPRERWLQIVAEFFLKKKVGTKNAKPINSMTPEEFLAMLRATPSLAGLDVDLHMQKCIDWYHVNRNGHVATRKEIFNWLLRQDKKVTKPEEKKDRSADFEPEGWRAKVIEAYGHKDDDRWVTYAREGTPWLEIPEYTRRQIVQAMNRWRSS